MATISSQVSSLTPDVIVCAGFGLWLGLTFLRYAQAIRFKRIMPTGRLKLIPVWVFFALDPSLDDVRVRLRSIQSTDGRGEWVEINCSSRRRWHNALWHPSRRADAATTRVGRTLHRVQRRALSMVDVERSIAYERMSSIIAQRARLMPPSHQVEVVVTLVQRAQGDAVETEAVRSIFNVGQG